MAEHELGRTRQQLKIAPYTGFDFATEELGEQGIQPSAHDNPKYKWNLNITQAQLKLTSQKKFWDTVPFDVRYVNKKGLLYFSY